MKHLKKIAALGIFVSALFSTNAFAIANAPPPPPGCTQITAGPASWPEGGHSYYCGAATAANGALMLAPLNGFTNMGKTSTEMVNLAGGTNGTNRGNFYLFDTPAEYAAAFPTYAQPTPGAIGLTVRDGGTGAAIFTAIFQRNSFGVTNQFIGNTTAHELGHWVDALEGAVLTGDEVIYLNGAVTVGHTITISATNGQIVGNTASVSVTSVAGDTLTTLSTKLKNAVNATAALTSKGFTATSSGASFTINYVGTSGPTYAYTITGAGAITEQVWLDSGIRASAAALLTHSLHGNPANTNGDIFTFNGKANCNTSASGVFNRQQDSDLKYICSTNTIGSMSGTITNNDQLTLTITDPAMNGGIGVPIHVQAMTGDTTATLATKFKNAINMNGTLSGAKITATSSGSNITINSGTGNVTTYSYFNAGGTENMTLVNQGNGEGSTLSTLKYNSAASNWTNLQTAWPGAVSIFVTDSETFAEVFAAQTG